MKYNRGNIEDTLRVARIVSGKDNKPRFVFATAYGFVIDKNPPPVCQQHYRIDRNNVECRPT